MRKHLPLAIALAAVLAGCCLVSYQNGSRDGEDRILEHLCASVERSWDRTAAQCR